MKKILFACLLAVCLLLPAVKTARGETIPEEVTGALPEEAEQLLDRWDAGDNDGGAMLRGLSGLWRSAREGFLTLAGERLGAAVLLLAAVLICGAAEGMQRASGGGESYVTMAGVLVITAATAGSVRAMAGVGTEALEQMELFSGALLPSLAAAAAAGGWVVSAGVRQVLTVLFIDALMDVIRRVLVPLVYCHAAVSAANAVLPEQDLKRLRDGIGKAVAGALKVLLAVFTAFLTVAGAAGTAADAAALRLTRSAISSAVPVVGTIISDAAASVLAGAGLLRSALGVFGMLGVLAICLTPFLKLAVQYGLYKLTALLAAAAGSGPLVDLVDALGTSFGLLLGMTGACAVMLLISVASSVSVVMT